MEDKLQESKGITRRGFFKWTLLGFGLTASAGVVGAIASQLLKALDPSQWFKNLYVYPKVYAGRLSDIEKAGSIIFEDTANNRKAVLVYNGGEIKAFSLACPHLGCNVSWEKDIGKFLCPCHGAIFASDGKVEEGPPPRPLDQYPVSVENGLVFVSFKEPAWQPERYFEGDNK